MTLEYKMVVGELGRQRNVLKLDVKKKICSGEQRYQNKYFGETPHMVGHQKFPESCSFPLVCFLWKILKNFSSHHHLTSWYRLQSWQRVRQTACS